MRKDRIRVLIVDDEPPAVARIRTLLKDSTDFEVVGDCGDGHSALKAIQQLRPDLIFLDIQMPGLGGFEVIDQLPLSEMPVVIFVTAFDQHAIRAFEVRALDYLLKPFDRNRFHIALDRAREQIAQERKQQDKCYPPGQISSVHNTLNRLAVKVDGHITLLELDSVVWIEAVGKYVNIHSTKGIFLHRETLQSLDVRLIHKRFVRIHRSALVNTHFISELEPVFHGDYVVRLKTGEQLPLGRKYRQRVRRLLGISN